MRLSELYTSIQGEGPNVGKPTQFVRFAGCNYRCALWPCDSPYAIDPSQYRHEWETLSVTDLIERISLWPKHLCFTGGEPFLQPEHETFLLLDQLFRTGYTVDFFTNGSFEIPQFIFRTLSATVVMDWKLQGSGEGQKNVANRIVNASRLRGVDALKFTVASREDLIEAHQIWDQYFYESIPVYVGAVWDKIEERKVVSYILENHLSWHLNVQVHKHIFDPDAREI